MQQSPLTLLVLPIPLYVKQKELDVMDSKPLPRVFFCHPSHMVWLPWSGCISYITPPLFDVRDRQASKLSNLTPQIIIQHVVLVSWEIFVVELLMVLHELHNVDLHWLICWLIHLPSSFKCTAVAYRALSLPMIYQTMVGNHYQ